MAKTKKFKLKRKTQKLELTGDYEGGEVVVVSSAPMSFLFQLVNMDGVGVKEQEELVRRFGNEIVVSWNFVDENDEDVPANGDGAVGLTSDLFSAIVSAWTESVGGDKNLDSQPSEPDTSV
jgi:hypothetical protein